MEPVGIPIYWDAYSTKTFVIHGAEVRCNTETGNALFEQLILDASTHNIIITRSDTSDVINIACSIELFSDEYQTSKCGSKYFIESYVKGQRKQKLNLKPEISLNVRNFWVIRGSVIFFKSVSHSHLTKETTFKQLSDDFSALLSSQDPSFTDVTLRCGSTIIPAHKNILSARTPVFAAMFRSDMKESRDGTVVIEHLQPSTLESMLIYVYSGKVQQLNVPTAGELLVAADMYQLRELGAICCDYLTTALSIDNVLDILVIGNLHDPKLKTSAVDFICKLNSFSSLKKKDTWKALQAENPSLTVEVLSSVVEYIQGKEKVPYSSSISQRANPYLGSLPPQGYPFKKLGSRIR